MAAGGGRGAKLDVFVGAVLPPRFQLPGGAGRLQSVRSTMGQPWTSQLSGTIRSRDVRGAAVIVVMRKPFPATALAVEGWLGRSSDLRCPGQTCRRRCAGRGPRGQDRGPTLCGCGRQCSLRGGSRLQELLCLAPRRAELYDALASPPEMRHFRTNDDLWHPV